jgi:hypothetical protein
MRRYVKIRRSVEWKVGLAGAQNQRLLTLAGNLFSEQRIEQVAVGELLAACLREAVHPISCLVAMEACASAGAKSGGQAFVATLEDTELRYGDDFSEPGWQDTPLTRLRERCCAGERSIYDPLPEIARAISPAADAGLRPVGTGT